MEMQNGFITSYTIFWANSIPHVASESCLQHTDLALCPISVWVEIPGAPVFFSERVRELYGSLPASRDLRGCAGGGILSHQQPPVPPGATVNPSLSSFVIRGLKPSTLYKVHIMASTAAGGTNGTSLTLVTTVLGEGCSHPGRGDMRGPAAPGPHGTAQLAVPTAVPCDPVLLPR